jgi:cytochrome c-type biogenesis protein CcmH/NrfG
MSRHSHRASIPELPAGCWKASQAYILAVVTLITGIFVGYLVRGSAGVSPVGQATTSTADNAFTQSSISPAAITAKKTESLIAQLRSRPNDPELLAEIGNAYYDGQDYTNAIDYYQRSLKLRPDQVDVRTDMGTAIWYSGDADGALREYEQVLKHQPNHPNALMNMGVVKWNGKKDATGAIAAWEKLLAIEPAFPQRQKVEEMLQNARREVGRPS